MPLPPATVTVLILLQANYSLSGAFHRLSKLILCVVMIRGRHRGLPVALDRSVMLPREFRQHTTEAQAEQSGLSESSVPTEGRSGSDASTPTAVSSEEQH